MTETVSNRIRELRLALKLTQAELAVRVGTTPASITRYELGQRKLSEDLMRRFATALGVRPSDLFGTLALAEVDPDLEVEAVSDLAPSLNRLQITPCRMISDAIELSGIARGRRLLIDGRAKLEDLKPGAAVAVEVSLPNGTRALIARQFIPPTLLTTNRAGINSALRLDDPALSLRYVGALITD